MFDYKKKIKILNNIKSLKPNINSQIMISSFQYSVEIKNTLNKINPRLDIFSPYDNGSRSIIDNYYIKKYKGLNKIYSKRIF